MTTLLTESTLLPSNQDNFFIIPESLSSLLGYEEALVLSRIKYWIKVCGRKLTDSSGLWIYNSQKSWHEQFSFFSLYKVKKVIYSLEKKGFLLSKKVNAAKWNHTKWYTIDFEKLDSAISDQKKSYNINTSKSTNRLADNQPIINKQRNNYTNKSSLEKDFNLHASEDVDKNIENFSIKTNDQIELNVINNQIKEKENNFLLEEQKEVSTFSKKLKIEEYNQTEYQKINNCTDALLTIPSEDEENVAKRMVEIWNEEFKYSINPIKAYLTDKIKTQLCKIYHNCFHNSEDKWREYVLRVNSSKFLMGEKKTNTGFKAMFAWLIKQEIVESIMNGAYGVGDRKLDKDNLFGNIEVQKESIVSSLNNKIIEYIKQNISETKERAEFKEYILREKFEEDGDIYEMKKWLKNNCHFSIHSLFYDKKNEAIYQNLYDIYIMKKCFGKTKTQMKKTISDILEGISYKYNGINLFKELGNMMSKISFMNLDSREVWQGLIA